MKLIKEKRKIRCEMGVCKNLSDYTIVLDRVGIKSNIHICSSCLKQLYGIIGENVIPKSIETAAKMSRKDKCVIKELV